MAVVPDTKNWTWVLTKPCPQCGFDASTYPAHQVAHRLRENIAAWRALLSDPLVGQRPTDSVWSALEYGCHVRDVFHVFEGRLWRMLTEDDPLFENWDQDQTALAEHYQEQLPAVALSELEAAGGSLASVFESVAGAAWQRPGRRSDGSAFTIDTLSRYMLHDVIHHVWDVRLGLAQLRSRPGRD